MTITQSTLASHHDGQSFEAFVATPDTKTPRPAVIFFHAWMGRMAYDDETAKRAAALGYVGVSADMYGVGIRGTTMDENAALMTPLKENRPYLQERLKVILKDVAALEQVDETQIIVAGFCFGGLCALDMARIGADIKGAAAFHAIFPPPGNTNGQTISAKIIAFHGYNDPMATPADLVAFGSEMTSAKADWQVHAYGGVSHAFTNPNADNPEFGLEFNQQAADRSWQSFTNFLQEIVPIN